MPKNTFKNGVPLSSTPIQSLEDSGYFGSDKKNSCKTKACPFSPLQEYSLKSAVSEQSLLEQDSNVTETLNKANAKENLTLSKCNSFTENIYDLAVPKSAKDKIHLSASPYDSFLYISRLCSLDSLSQDSDIKYELFPGVETESEFGENEVLQISRTKVDFLQRLKRMNCESIISVILSCLTAEDLCKVSCVNKTWRSAVSEDKKANSKRKEFLMQRKINLTGATKENRLGMRFGPSRGIKSSFSCITNTYLAEQVSKTEAEKTKFDSFLKEAKGQPKLQKCPKCGYASKVLDRDTCVCTHCCHKFCSICYDPIIESHECSKPQIPNTIIGSKKSKKNLRRL